MADIQLTPAQEAAVTDRDGALLVSAAAGSGKTKVLVDRLMAQICDPVRPRNINDYLIITYTKAAASELRAKISAELGKRLALDPTNRHLQRQLSLVYLTEISTVHAFCSTLLRTYAHLLDLPSDFRVVEEAQGRQLRDHRPAHRLPLRQGHHPEVRRQDRPSGHRPGGRQVRRLGC